MSAEREERRAGLLFVLPAVVALLAVALYPLVATFGLALERRVLVFGERRFVGLANLRFLLEDPRFWAALGHTLYFTGVAVALELLLALPLALLLDARVRGRALLRAGALLPWAVPTVVSARLWAWLFDPGAGLVNRVVPGPDLNWLGDPTLAFHAAIVVDAWKTTPFVALLLLAGLQAIPQDLYRAARVDGAGPWRTLWRVTLPLLRPALLLAVLFRALDAFRVFDVLYVLTEGGPANATETLSLYAYKTLMRAGDFGYGAALCVATFVAAGLLSALLLLAWRRWGGEEAAR